MRFEHHDDQAYDPVVVSTVNLHETVTVYSSKVVSEDEGAILVEAGGHEPIEWFLRHATRGTESDSNPTLPPAKRRKTVAKIAAPLESGSQLNPIPLQKINVDLVCSRSLVQAPDPAWSGTKEADLAQAEESDVHVVHISQDGDIMGVALAKDKDRMLIMDIEKLSETARHLLTDFSHHVLQGHRAIGGRPASFIQYKLTSALTYTHTIVRIQATLFWRSGISGFSLQWPRIHLDKHSEFDLIKQLFHDETQSVPAKCSVWKPSDFYNSIAAPNSHNKTSLGPIDGLETELYPFQHQTVKWMLHREGKQFEKGRLTCRTQADLDNYYTKYKDAEGNTCYVSHLFCVVTRTEPAPALPLLGGLLAEEMGLGKTVELIALISLHQMLSTENKHISNAVTPEGITPSRATLIVMPESILQQWVNEFAKHAPTLRVMIYEGVRPPSKKPKPDELVYKELTQDHDVVLVTYNTLRKEIHYARDPPQRDMRHAKKFESKRSPLVLIRWWRICLDEAQMVESGVTTAAQVVRRLPRVNAWATSGTPLRKNVQDLQGLLVFLKLQPFCDDNKLWNHMVREHRSIFQRLWRTIAIRHTKAQVHQELGIPPQRRFILTMPFTTIEQQHYSTLFQEMCQDIGMNEDGSPSSEDWNPETQTETMRSWLVRLRQTCLHPQVGHRNRRALGRGRQGPLRTVGEVLEVMIEQNEGNLRAEERTFLATRLVHGHVLGNVKDDMHRSEKALNIYLSALKNSEVLVKEARERLEERLADVNVDLASKASMVEDDADGEAKSMLGRFRSHLRSALQLRHTCLFFVADSYYQIKADESLTVADSDEYKKLESQETNVYEEAKEVRREILRDSSHRAQGLMHRISQMLQENKMVRIPPIAPLKSLAGIENRRLVLASDQLFELIEDLCKVILEWRRKMAEYLSTALVDTAEETTGEEYEQSTKQQDELYAYFDCVKAVQADLHTLITGESEPLIDYEMKVMVKEARSTLDPDNAKFARAVHAPELVLKLLAVRNEFRARFDEIGSVRGLIVDARALDGSLQMQGSSRSEGERTLVQRHLKGLQKVFGDYSKMLVELEKELDLFRTTQNQRLEFYRQLQELSDAVKPFREELDEHLDATLLQSTMKKEEEKSKAIALLKTKHRFLLHLRKESGNSSTARMCVVCQCPFENGVLTVCGHQYCAECIHLWWSQHRTCPVCKRVLRKADFNNVTYKPQEFRAKEEDLVDEDGTNGKTASPSKAQSNGIYNRTDERIMNEIKTIDLPRSYGTKIDTLGRHLLWIRQNGAGTKSVVFSQYREFLDVLSNALSAFKIRNVRLGSTGAVDRFRNDASIDCILIDAKTDSSGLTLVNATNVFICEPLVHTAVELQAIARVHRIGQRRQTTVWMYLISDTVEEAIYELSVSRRLAHVQSYAHRTGPQAGFHADLLQLPSDSDRRAGKTAHETLSETALEAAETAELESAPMAKFLTAGRSGGEIVEKDDLWRCLFGNAKANAARATSKSLGLLAEAGVDNEDDENAGDQVQGRVRTEVDRFLRVEAVDRRMAGSSRLEEQGP